MASTQESPRMNERCAPEDLTISIHVEELPNESFLADDSNPNAARDRLNAKLLGAIMFRNKLWQMMKQYQLRPAGPTLQIQQEIGAGDAPLADFESLDIQNEMDPLEYLQMSYFEVEATIEKIAAEIIDVLGEEDKLVLQQSQTTLLQWLVQNRWEILAYLKLGPISKQMAGSVLGYGSALAIRKFGKSILYLVSGGLITIHLANRQKFIQINWDRVCGESEGQGNQRTLRKIFGKWFAKRMSSTADWAKGNTSLATGFLVGFLVKSYTS